MPQIDFSQSTIVIIQQKALAYRHGYASAFCIGCLSNGKYSPTRDSPLNTKSKEFALRISKACNNVKRNKAESVLTNQLIRSGSGIGANIRKAFCGHGSLIAYGSYEADFMATTKWK